LGGVVDNQSERPHGGDGFESAWRAVDGVDGWMTEGQARMLWDCASSVPRGGTIAEIGSYRGRSAIVIALAAPAAGEIAAIDPHAGNDRGPQQIEGTAAEGEGDHELFHANLRNAGVDGRIRHVRMPSEAAHGDVPGPLDMLYVDGAHRYGPARDDIRDWGAKVAPGGTMLIHDSFSSIGVTLAQVRLLFASGDWRYEGRSRSLAMYRRTGLSGAARVRNLATQAVQLAWFARNVLIKVLISARLRPIARLLDGGRGEWPY